MKRVHVYVSISVCVHMDTYTYACTENALLVKDVCHMRNTGRADIYRHRANTCALVSAANAVMALPFQIKNLNKLSGRGKKQRAQMQRKRNKMSVGQSQGV